uniref:Uncharacterized protein n=1 Tax=Ditylum brightwellii TaxID=49249 RepID=A0A6V2AYZ0_9STRA|mmetsp:Transcript_13870/g.20224  ORF Transcript_13870/g.20224 Transcript_13870/m.20224 type:complete len:231 (-) Transcript_13870:165-857(-)
MKMTPSQTHVHQPSSASSHPFMNTTQMSANHFLMEQALKRNMQGSNASSAFGCSHAHQIQHTTSPCFASSGGGPMEASEPSKVTFLVQTPGGRTAQASVCPSSSYDAFVDTLLHSAVRRDSYGSSDMMSSSLTEKRSLEEERRQHRAQGQQDAAIERRVRRRMDVVESASTSLSPKEPETASRSAFVVHNGRILDREKYQKLLSSSLNGQATNIDVSIRLRLRGGVSCSR